MSDNKFIQKLKGTATVGSVLEIQNSNVATSFANMPYGTSDANRVYADHSGDAVGVLHGAENWKLNGSTLIYAPSINSDGRDYTGETDKTGGSVVLDGNGMAVSGAGLWVNATYTFSGDPTKTVAIFNAGTKWALKLCGHSLFSENKTIDLTVLIKIGTSSVISKVFTVTKDSFNFCKDLVIDFAESTQSIIKVLGNQTLTLQLLCSDTTASATIYNGMTVLTSLQRRVDMDVIAGGGYSLDGLETELNNIHSELNGKLNLDGTNTMTGVLKMRASVSFQCAIAPYWDGVGFYKLNDNDSVTMMASMEETTGFSPFSTNKYDIGTSSKKWKNLYLAGKAYIATINNGGDIAVPTKAGTMALESDIGRTNCITEIPQDINLELSSGTLTLKTGSKVYVPNGSGVYTQKTITSDVTTTISWAGTSQRMLFVTFDNDLNIVGLDERQTTYSGTTQPTTPSYFAWYDTTNNVIKMTTDGGSTWNRPKCSFPIAIISSTSNVITAIDQVFNGFGYIGKQIFMLPGLTGLAPNGRNADGTLKNAIVSLSSVLLGSAESTSTFTNRPWLVRASMAYSLINFVIQDDLPAPVSGRWQACYSPRDNKLYQSDNGGDWFQSVGFLLGTTSRSSGAITNFDMKQAFVAVDYNDTEYVAHQAMPSDKSINLTLPSMGSTLTAPADGYISVSKATTAAGQYFTLINNTNYVQAVAYPNTSGFNCRVMVPVSKGDVITCNYSADGTTNFCKFIYANGAK